MGRRANTPEERAQRKRAYNIMDRALRSGELVRPWGCADCPPLHAHHHLGYDYPLDVVWLCPTHHGMAHGDLGIEITDDHLVQYYRWRMSAAKQMIREASVQLKALA